jgi:hypothetical protein
MRAVGALDRRRIRDVLFALFVATGFVFGLGPLLAPRQFSDITQFRGTDVLVLRLAGCATLGYGIGFLLGFRAPWRQMWIAVVSVMVFNIGSLVACAAAIAAGNAQPVVYLVTVVSILFVAGAAYLLRNPPVDPGEPATVSGPPDIAQWLLYLFVIGTAAALVFGLGPLILGGQFGKLLNAPGNDDWIYRQAGASTLGGAIGGIFAIRSRRWEEIRIPTVMALTFNGTAVIAAILDIAAGTAQPVTYLIIATAGLVTVGTALALSRNGR